MHPVQAQYFHHPLGSIVGKRLGPLHLPQHVGILVPHPIWGRAVISFRPNGIVVEPAHQFASGRPFDSVSYPSQLPWQIVVQCAQQAVANRPYDLINFNCDYFVRHCHGLKLESPQVATIAVLAVIGLGLALASAA